MADKHTIFDPAFVDQQRKRLEELREQQLQEEQDVRRELMTEEEAEGETEDAEIHGRLQARLKDIEERLQAIDVALQKIFDGSYGFSVESGEPISKARLQAMPEALRTVQEEEERERRERL